MLASRRLCFVSAGIAAYLTSFTIAASVPSPAAYPACQREPNEGDTQGAKGAFQAGSASFNEADYERAILYWEDAYRRDCTAHDLLRNLARAYELNGQLRHAIVALETYVERVPDAAKRGQIETRIENLRQRAEREDEAQRQREAALAERERRHREAAAPRPKPAPPPIAPKPKPQRATGVHPAIPLALGGVGAATAVVSSAIYFVALDDLDDYRKLCPDNRCSPSLLPKARSVQSTAEFAGWTAAAGTAVAAGGLVWYFVNPRGKTEEAELAPLWAPSFAGASLRGRF